jgi:Bacteriophage lambda head decoration protein D
MAYERAGYEVSTPTSFTTILARTAGVTTRKITVLSGEGIRIAGSVMGKVPTAAQTVTAGAVVSGSGGTPGNGTVSALSADTGALAGVYQVRILNPATNAGSFEVIRPDGSVDGNGAVGVAYNGTINFTLGDGSVDFVEDDRIPITVSYANDNGKYRLSTAAAVDGSQIPDMVLAETVDATSADVEAIAYETATVVKSALVLGAGHSIASIRATLRHRGITIDD